MYNKVFNKIRLPYFDRVDEINIQIDLDLKNRAFSIRLFNTYTQKRKTLLRAISSYPTGTPDSIIYDLVKAAADHIKELKTEVDLVGQPPIKEEPIWL